MPARHAPTVELVPLRGGPTIPLKALELAWDLEFRGLQFRADGDRLIVSPAAILTDRDREQIRQWKTELLAVVGYCDAEGWQ